MMILVSRCHHSFVFCAMLFPCAYKQLFGIDCPLCGGQRSLMLLVDGHWGKSFLMYPPLIPVLLLTGIFAAYLINRNFIRRRFLVRSATIVLIIVMVNYIFTLAFGHPQ
jgi:hypothetical protein